MVSLFRFKFTLLLLQAGVLVVGSGFVFEDQYQHWPVRPVLIVSLAVVEGILFVRPREELAAPREAPEDAPLVAF